MDQQVDYSEILQDYTLSYNDFLLSVNQTSAIDQLAIKFLDDFPNQLPSHWLVFYEKMTAEFKKSIPLGIVESIKTEDPFMGALLMSDFFYSRVYVGQPIHYIKAIISIYLVMLFSHIDAFLGESIKIIAHVKPEIIPNSKYKNLEFDERLDKYIKDLTMRNLSEIIKKLREIGVQIDISSDIDISFLERTEFQRHAYVHNGGRANSLYIKRTGDTRFKSGSDIVFVEWQKLYVNIIALGSDVYRSICKQYLNTPEVSYWKIGEPNKRPPEDVINVVVGPP